MKNEYSLIGKLIVATACAIGIAMSIMGQTAANGPAQAGTGNPTNTVYTNGTSIVPLMPTKDYGFGIGTLAANSTGSGVQLSVSNVVITAQDSIFITPIATTGSPPIEYTVTNLNVGPVTAGAASTNNFTIVPLFALTNYFATNTTLSLTSNRVSWIIIHQ